LLLLQIRARKITCKKFRARSCVSSSATRRKVEVTRIRVSSIALRWVLAFCLTATPLLAEVPPQPSPVVAPHRPVVQVVDENNNPIVGSSILSAMMLDSKPEDPAPPAAAPPAAPEPRRDDRRAEPGGKTWSSVLLAALLAGGVVLAILLLKGGHDKPGATPATTPAPTPATVTPPPAETGTILAPGTPSVGSH